MRNRRTRYAHAGVGLALAATLGVVGVQNPAAAEPDIDDVEDRVSNIQGEVDNLYHQAEQASERLHDARIDLKEIRADLKSLRADEKRQSEDLGVVRDQLAESVVSQYQGQSMSAVGQMVLSEDPDQFLADLSALSSYQDVQAEVFDRYSTKERALNIRRDAVAERTAELKKVKEQLAAEKAEVDEKAAAAETKLEEAEDLLAELKEKERRRLAQEVDRSHGGGDEVAANPAPASGRGGAAVSFAMGQVGDAYVYGANGPDAWDCSGLTTAAWAQAGVSLPRSSSAQYSSGPKVPESQLQPGDLVFYYTPISHVGIYIGNGQIVHAANPSTGVNTTSLHSMPYVGAVRPG